MFGKLSKEQILKALNALSDEEKAEVIKAASNIEQPQNTEEGKDAAPDATSVEEKPTEVNSVEAPKETPTESATSEEEQAQEPPAVATTEAPAEPDKQDEENKNEIISQLSERVAKMETTIAKFSDLYAKMEEFTAKQAEKFGYESKAQGENKPYSEMSVDELKKAQAIKI